MVAPMVGLCATLTSELDSLAGCVAAAGLVVAEFVVVVLELLPQAARSADAASVGRMTVIDLLICRPLSALPVLFSAGGLFSTIIDALAARNFPGKRRCVQDPVGSAERGSPALPL
jgi:hypothetical protein